MPPQDAERLSHLRSQASFDEHALDQDMDDVFNEVKLRAAEHAKEGKGTEKWMLLI